MRTFRLGEEELKRFTNFEWDQIDFLNGIYLKIRGEEAGTQFHKYNTGNVFHHADMLEGMQELMGRLFEGLGFQRDVPHDNGFGYRSFLAALKRIQKFAIGLAAEEQKAAHSMIDDYAKRGLKAAGEAARRVILGPSPADRRLGVFLASDEAVVIELRETLDAIKDVATFRRRMGSVFGAKTKAATLTGFTLAGGGGGGGSGSGGGGGGGGGGRGGGQGGGGRGGGGTGGGGKQKASGADQ